MLKSLLKTANSLQCLRHLSWTRLFCTWSGKFCKVWGLISITNRSFKRWLYGRLKGSQLNIPLNRFPLFILISSALEQLAVEDLLGNSAAIKAKEIACLAKPLAIKVRSDFDSISLFENHSVRYPVYSKESILYNVGGISPERLTYLHLFSTV